VRSIFNVLGPLANPALAEFQLLGVYDPALTRVMAEALRTLGSSGAVVVHCAGLDEIGLHAVTTGHRLQDGEITEFRLDPKELGVDPAPVAALSGGELDESLAHMRAALAGDPGPRTDIVALNAATALQITGRTRSIAEGLELARTLLESGAGLRVLERYAESSTRKVEERGK
jgi:anthranilate phosphoribosyltransferase